MTTHRSAVLAYPRLSRWASFCPRVPRRSFSVLRSMFLCGDAGRHATGTFTPNVTAMRIGENVRLAIDAMEAEPREIELAMMLACAAIDGTARRRYPALASRARFVQTVRDFYWLIEPLALRGINLDETLWTNLSGPSSKTPPDFAEVLYSIHRCNHMHGDEVPFGHVFTETTDVSGGLFAWQWTVAKDVLALPDRLPFALVACAVLAPENALEETDDGYYFYNLDCVTYEINDWWGRAEEFRPVAAANNLIRVKLEPGTDW